MNVDVHHLTHCLSTTHPFYFPPSQVSSRRHGTVPRKTIPSPFPELCREWTAEIQREKIHGIPLSLPPQFPIHFQGNNETVRDVNIKFYFLFLIGVTNYTRRTGRIGTSSFCNLESKTPTIWTILSWYVDNLISVGRKRNHPLRLCLPRKFDGRSCCWRWCDQMIVASASYLRLLSRPCLSRLCLALN